VALFLYSLPALSLNLPATAGRTTADVKPLFLLGVPRSGTTFLQQVLDAHPQIFITDELRAVAWLVRETHRLREGFPVHGTPYPVNYGPQFADYLLNNANWIISAFYLRQAKRAGKPAIRYWGDKFPHYDEVLHLMPRLFPRSCFVVIHRDLRDIVCSLNTGHQWTVDRSAPYACMIFDRYMRKIDTLVREGTVPADHFVHVDYFDFHANAEAEAGRIFAALGLDYPPATAERVRELRTIQSHSIRRPGGKAQKFNIGRSQARWTRDLTPADLDLLLGEIAKIQGAVDIGNRLKPGQPYLYPPPSQPLPTGAGPEQTTEPSGGGT
jgi:hypothetical protein